jgi:DNA-binding transcriptional regulator YiaG
VEKVEEMTGQAKIPGAGREALTGHEMRTIRRYWLYCTANELARVCRVSLGTVYRWEKKGVSGTGYVLIRTLAKPAEQEVQSG